MYQVERFFSLDSLNDWLREHSDRIEAISLNVYRAAELIYLLFRVK